MRKCFQLVIVVVLIASCLKLTASAEKVPVNVSFTARGFVDAIQSYGPPDEFVPGFFSFVFDFDQPAGEFFYTPTNAYIVIAEGTDQETDFSKKVLGIGVQWNGNAFTRIRFWAGSVSFYSGGDDFILVIFPEGSGQNMMRYSLLSAFNYYLSKSISFDVNVCNNLIDSDGDGVTDCDDLCSKDPYKTEPGICGCGVSEIDTDGDGKVDCMDANDDGDGLYDYVEWGPDQNDTEYDGNGDGTADHLQGNVASFHTFNYQNYVTLESPTGTLISNCTAENYPSESNAPLDIEFSFGFFKFNIENLGIGEATAAKFHFPLGDVFNTYYKYGPTPDNPNNHWYEFLYDGQTGAMIIGNVITLHFVDGMRGDDDLMTNGTISDIGAPGTSADFVGGGDTVSPVVSGSGGGGGGCFISTVKDGSL